MTDDPFAQSLTMWVSVYTMMRMDAGQPLTAFQVLSALLAVMATVLDQYPEDDRAKMALLCNETLLELLEIREPSETPVFN